MDENIKKERAAARAAKQKQETNEQIDANKKLERLRTDFPYYAENCLKIVNENGELVPLKLNDQQLKLHELIEKQKRETGKVRVIVLKSRRLGISTYVAGRFLHHIASNKHKRGAVITHMSRSTDALFRIYKRMHAQLPSILQPNLKKSNATDMEFEDIDSSLTVTTAGSAETGRGDTFQLLHGSELGFWENSWEIAAGLFTAVSKTDGSEIILESTSNGITNLFYDYWVKAERGESQYIPIFLPWTCDPGCYLDPPQKFELDDEEKQLQDTYQLSLGQLYWRRITIADKGDAKFRREYPISVEEAFRDYSGDPFITPELVSAARKRKLPPEPKNMPLILGIDVAAMGNDSTVIVWRRGNTIEKYEKLQKMENDEVADYLIPIIMKDSPTKVFIDGTGGYGSGVAACLRLRGYDSEEINFSSSPLDEQYVNRRVEMYGNLRDWLRKEVSLPDNDEVEQDLTSFGYKHTSKGQLQLESKTDVKKRLKRSPDIGDAIALCFTYELGPYITQGINTASWDLIRNRRQCYQW